MTPRPSALLTRITRLLGGPLPGDPQPWEALASYLVACAEGLAEFNSVLYSPWAPEHEGWPPVSDHAVILSRKDYTFWDPTHADRLLTAALPEGWDDLRVKFWGFVIPQCLADLRLLPTRSEDLQAALFPPSPAQVFGELRSLAAQGRFDAAARAMRALVLRVFTEQAAALARAEVREWAPYLASALEAWRASRPEPQSLTLEEARYGAAEALGLLRQALTSDSEDYAECVHLQSSGQIQKAVAMIVASSRPECPVPIYSAWDRARAVSGQILWEGAWGVGVDTRVAYLSTDGEWGDYLHPVQSYVRAPLPMLNDLDVRHAGMAEVLANILRAGGLDRHARTLLETFG